MRSTRPNGNTLDRRAFLVAASAAGLAAACGSGAASGAGSSVDDGGADDYRFDDDYRLLQVGFADGLRTPFPYLIARAPQRAPFILSGADGFPTVEGAPDALQAMVVAPDGASTAHTLKRHDQGIPTPYYLLNFETGAAGVHRIEAEVDGELQAIEFGVAEPDQVSLVQPGEKMRSVDTPTTANARGYDPVCTRFEPCPFHELNLADALTNGQPTVLLISTPGYCQTAICGPVLELLIEQDPGPLVNVIHVEVYTDPGRLAEVNEPSDLTGPIIATYGMEFEPSLIVADASGIVTGRLDYTFDLTELASVMPV